MTCRRPAAPPAGLPVPHPLPVAAAGRAATTSGPQLRVIAGADRGTGWPATTPRTSAPARWPPHRVEPPRLAEDVLAPGAVPDHPGSVTEILGR